VVATVVGRASLLELTRHDVKVAQFDVLKRAVRRTLQEDVAGLDVQMDDTTVVDIGQG
jgi:hypothetical protein